MSRARLLPLFWLLIGCGSEAEGDWGSESLDDVPSFSEPRADAPGWVRNQASAFWSDFGAIDAAAGPPFARAALELELPAADCEEAPCRLRGHSYVRVERAGDAISLLPHCSVVAEDSALLYRASGYGPWRLASGASAPSADGAHPGRHPSPSRISMPAAALRFGRGATNPSSSVTPEGGLVPGAANSGPPGPGVSSESRFWPPTGQIASARHRGPAFQTRSGQFEPLRRPSIFEVRDPIAIVAEEGDERGSGEADSLSEGPAELIGDGGARLRLRIERWWAPTAPPLAAWSAWLYTRALVRERARSFGIELGLFGGEDCEEHASLPQVHDVCWSTSGGPLSVLMDPTVPRYLDDSVPFYVPSEAEWVRRRVVSPVLAGHWQLFCGRLDGDQLRLSCDAVERRLRTLADELEAHGVSLTRFFAGASLVFGGRYYPQLSLDALATVAGCLGAGESLERELGRIAADPELDFPNRFRIEYVRGRLSGRDVGVTELRAWVPGPAADADDETRLEIDAADAACVEGLTGPMSLRSAG